MGADEVELRDRLKRAAGQIRGQHRRLEPLFVQLSRALASGIGRDAQTEAFRLDGAIRAHFLLEEKVAYPAIRGLCSQRDTELEALVEDHRALGGRLQDIIDRILEGRLDLAAQRLEKYQLALNAHESREEDFLAALDAAPSERNL